MVRNYFIIGLIMWAGTVSAQQAYGPNDTLVVPYIVYEGDTMTYRVLDMVLVWGRMDAQQRKAHREWTRLRNAVYVTYPYAKKAGFIINEVNANLGKIKDEHKRKKYLSQREKDLKKEFTEPLTNLSVYQGKVLMKLINRETSNNCYEIVKEYRGGFSARFWQTIAWVFGSSLKQPYNPKGEDAEMERIVLEVARMYGHAS
ncbi:MAG: hypothetical protein RL131_20 [Bacteroidota bacterium]